MKHTQGEWFIKEYYNSRDIHSEINGVSTLIACAYQLNGYPKDKDDNTIPCEQALANAKLISAAPDLLLTLQQIQFAVKSGAVKGLFKDEIEKMDNAIKKAIE